MYDEGNNQQKSSEQIEALRRILELEQHRSIEYEEAQEVGECLISFFEILAEEVT